MYLHIQKIHAPKVRPKSHEFGGHEFKSSQIVQQTLVLLVSVMAQLFYNRCHCKIIIYIYIYIFIFFNFEIHTLIILFTHKLTFISQNEDIAKQCQSKMYQCPWPYHNQLGYLDSCNPEFHVLTLGEYIIGLAVPKSKIICDKKWCR